MGERQTSLFSHGTAKTPRGSAPALPPSSRIVPLRAALALLPLPMSPAHVGNAVFIKQFGIWLAWLNTSKTHFELRVASAQGWGWACPAAGKGNRMWMCHGMRCTPEDPPEGSSHLCPCHPSALDGVWSPRGTGARVVNPLCRQVGRRSLGGEDKNSL